MSEECTKDCKTCGDSCNERREKNEFWIEPKESTKIGKIIGVVSGKGGVGKSLITSLCAVGMNKAGKQTAILDADITGPSIPKAFGVHGNAIADEEGILPMLTEGGIKLMSINLLLPSETDPVVWRGPVIAGAVKQFWKDVVWGDVDYMFVDMPPGTGDVALTIFQSLPIDGIIVVASPQELVSMIVEKAVKMAEKMDVPILGLVENMAYFECPDCHSKHYIFGSSHLSEVAEAYSLPVLAELPIDPMLSSLSDSGSIEQADTARIKQVLDAIESL